MKLINSATTRLDLSQKSMINTLYSLAYDTRLVPPLLLVCLLTSIPSAYRAGMITTLLLLPKNYLL